MKYAGMAATALLALGLSIGSGFAQGTGGGTGPGGAGGGAGAAGAGAAGTSAGGGGGEGTSGRPITDRNLPHTISGGTGATTGNIIAQEQLVRVRPMLVTPAAPPVASVNFGLTVGTVVPPSVQLYELPPTAVEVVPAFRGHRFFRTGDQVVVVDPASNRIVHVF